MSWIVENSEKIYSGKAFDVQRDQVRLPDGTLKQRDVVLHPPAVTVLPIDDESNVWFIRQYRHPVGVSLLELPAGVMDEGETPETAARRELREEIGMSANQLSLISSFYLAPGYSTEIMYAFLARGLYPDPLKGDDDEFIEIEKIPAATLNREMIQKICQDAKTLAILLLAPGLPVEGE